jgi:hypothetical protein
MQDTAHGAHAQAIRLDDLDILIANGFPTTVFNDCDSEKPESRPAQNKRCSAEARAAGEHKFLGTLCKNGHDNGDGHSIRWTRDGKCVECRKAIVLRASKIDDDTKRGVHPSDAGLARHKIDREAYDTMVSAQRGCCAICKRGLDGCYIHIDQSAN